MPEDDAGLQQEIDAWLQRNWDPDLTVREWWERVGEAGWTAPHFSLEWRVRGYSRRSLSTVYKAFRAAGAVAPPGGLGMMMAAPTILTHGTPEQVDRHVTPIYNGSLAWCQLFSEPGNGSDLAGLTTKATRDGDRWIISGQKVWSSQAMESDWGMLLARTDFDAPCSTRCSSTMRWSRTPTSSADSTTGGPSPTPRCSSSAAASVPAVAVAASRRR